MDALLVSPGADLRYLTGYEALPLERLTCLVLPASGDPLMGVPALEKPAAEASPLGRLNLEILPWNETDDPYALIASRLPVWVTVALAIFFELLALYAIRDNLTLNVLMLVYPIAGIKTWQSGL